MADKCSNCDHAMRENKSLRTGLKDLEKVHGEIINENIRLRALLDASGINWRIEIAERVGSNGSPE